MLKAALCLVLLTPALLFQAGDALAKPPSDPEKVIHGLGERQPAARDVSLSKDFHVYKFTKDGIEYIQVNSLEGEVITVVGRAGSKTFTLPIGSLPATQTLMSFDAALDSSVASEPMATATATCPCSATVVYQDANVRIVVVYGSNGEVIQVITVNLKPEQAEK